MCVCILICADVYIVVCVCVCTRYVADVYSGVWCMVCGVFRYVADAEVEEVWFTTAAVTQGSR